MTSDHVVGASDEMLTAVVDRIRLNDTDMNLYLSRSKTTDYE